MTTKYRKAKTIVFPTPKMKYEYSNGDSWYREVRGFVSSHALKLLNEKQSLLPQDELVELLLTILYDEGAAWITSDYEDIGEYGWLNDSQLEELAISVSQWALDTWDPQYIAKIRQARSRGGQKSKRPPVFTPDILGTVAGLSRAEQAKALGVSTATVARLRKRQKAELAGES